MKLQLPVTLAAAAALALASAPAFAAGAGCPCAAGAAKASAKPAKATKPAVKTAAVKTTAVAKQTPAKVKLAEAAPAAIPSISHEALVKAIADKKVTVIDVNGTESFKKGRIPGAIDFAAVSGDLGAKLPADKGALVVAYCGSEYCGAYKHAANAAKALGYTNVSHYSPGLKGWKASGQPLDKG